MQNLKENLEQLRLLKFIIDEYMIKIESCSSDKDFIVVRKDLDFYINHVERIVNKLKKGNDYSVNANVNYDSTGPH